MKSFRTTFSFAILAATFAASAPVLARPVVNAPEINDSQVEGESPTATLIASGDVAPPSWAITQRLDIWAALSGIGSSFDGVLQRRDTLDAPERDEKNTLAVRRVTSASQSPADRETVDQDVTPADDERPARTLVAHDLDAESSPAPDSPSSQTTSSSVVSSTPSSAVVEPAVKPAVAPAPAKSAGNVTATSTRTARVGTGGTTQRANTTRSNTVVGSKAVGVAPVSKQIDGMKVPLVKAVPRRDPAQLSARHKNRILLARLEADLMRANRGLDRANDTLSKGQKQLMQVGSTLRTAMLEAGPDAKGLHPFVRVAMRYAGTPYVWGGESRNGFDCSGFIIVVMRDLGYHALPHSAAEQYNYGTPIAQELLKPGDIVFFKNTYKRGVSHVGIYLGNRRYIEAAGTGKGTIVSSLDSARAQAHYAGARRLVRS